MLKYFPFSGTFDLKMGTSMMSSEDPIVEVDEHYEKEVSLKRSLLQSDHMYYFQSRLASTEPEWDALILIATQLAHHYPNSFSFDSGCKFSNRRLNSAANFTGKENTIEGLSVLDWIGRQIQEDLIILNSAGEVVAGQLCFPSGWAIGEKIGKKFMEVHAPLPELTNPMINLANKLIERLPLNKPVMRNNWGFRLGDQLDLSSRHSDAYRSSLLEETMTVDNIGDKIFLRVEHQTLTRLPSGFVLFTIHTYNSPLSEEASDPVRKAEMLTFMDSTPEPLIVYKQMATFYKILIDYLRQ